MKSAGGLLWVLGVLLILVGLFYNTTIVSGTTDASYLSTAPVQMVDPGRLQHQLIMIHLGIGAVIVGTLFVGFGALADVARPFAQDLMADDDEGFLSFASENRRGMAMALGIALLVVLAAMYVGASWKRPPSAYGAAAVPADVTTDLLETDADRVASEADQTADRIERQTRDARPSR